MYIHSKCILPASINTLLYAVLSQACFEFFINSLGFDALWVSLYGCPRTSLIPLRWRSDIQKLVIEVPLIIHGFLDTPSHSWRELTCSTAPLWSWPKELNCICDCRDILKAQTIYLVLMMDLFECGKCEKNHRIFKKMLQSSFTLSYYI